MELTEDEIFEKYAKQRMHCTRNTFLTYEYGGTRAACGYNVVEQGQKLTKIYRRK